MTLHYLLVVLITILTFSNCYQPKVPDKFGLLTVTHTRAGDNSQFHKYMKRYFYMDCPAIQEISIVWNNQKSMEQLGIFKDRQNWKIPVYFYCTPYNSMYWRFNIPNQTKSEVFFSLDDDIIVDCEELMKGFKVWQQNAIGTIGPMVTYEHRLFEFKIDKHFNYGRSYQKDYFTLGLNMGFVSRHFLELYYADLWELNQLKEHILKKNNCDDIALNYIIQYFYPQLPTKVIRGKIQNRSPAIGQSTGKEHYRYRDECLNDFSEIFGYNPLRYICLKDKFAANRQKKLLPITKEIVLAKQQYINKYILKKQVVNTGYSKLLSKIQNKEKQSQSKAMKPQKKLQKKVTKKDEPTAEQKLDQLNHKVHKLQLQNKDLNVENRWRSYMQVFMGLLVVILCCKLFYLSRKYQFEDGKNQNVIVTATERLETQIEQTIPSNKCGEN